MNFKWEPEKATLLIRIPEMMMDPRLISYATKNGYEPKPELHVTLLSFQNGKKISQAVGHDREVVFGRILELANSYSWAVEYLPEYFVLERTIGEFVLHGKIQTPTHTRRTIIQKVLMPDLADFLGKVSEMTGASFDHPFPHVTLFAWSDYEPEMTSGIGLDSEEDFKKYYKETILFK